MTEIQQEMDVPKILSHALLNKVCINIFNSKSPIPWITAHHYQNKHCHMLVESIKCLKSWVPDNFHKVEWPGDYIRQEVKRQWSVCLSVTLLTWQVMQTYGKTVTVVAFFTTRQPTLVNVASDKSVFLPDVHCIHQRGLSRHEKNQLW
jgi:hypothetical protein